MKLLADLHVHSNFSRFGHGKSTIEDIVIRANELGLKEVAITDHGFKHFFRTSKKKLATARKIIDEINTWSQTKVLLGIEADIINEQGDLDIDEETLDMIDILIAGYHRMIKTDFAGYFGSQKKTQKAINKVTNAYINAINRWPIHFISHIDSVLKSDLYAIGCACKENDIAIEINNRHLKWNEDQVYELIASNCSFVVSSDAHISDNVGCVDEALRLIKRYKIPAMSVLNVEFDEFELTKKDKEERFYVNLYKHFNQDDEDVKEAIVASEEQEIQVETTKEVPKLSKEMEDALERLAHEQGIKNYQRKDGEDSVINTDRENFESQNEVYYGNNLDSQNIDNELENISNDVFENNVIEQENIEDNYYQNNKNVENKSYMSHIERTYNVKTPNSSNQYLEEVVENKEVDELENITNSLNQFKPKNYVQFNDNGYQNTQEQNFESKNTQNTFNNGQRMRNSNGLIDFSSLTDDE